MRQVIVLIIFAMFLGSAMSIGNIGVNTQGSSKVITHKETFEAPDILENENYAIISLKNSNYLHITGNPMMPYKTEVHYFPLGTKIDVSIDVEENGATKIDKKIMPAPPFQPLGGDLKMGEIYNNDTLYPSAWYDYKIGGGIHNGKHVTILAIHLYPYRYNPAKNEILSANFNVKIKYDEPKKKLDNSDYDLIIIAPQQFENALQPLIEHKEKHGIRTVFMSVEDIYSSFDGRDGAEKVKYAIKDAIEKWGIKYVLLVGGKKSYITGNWGYDGPEKVDDSLWWVPVRYVALNDGTESGYLSDLYFADIYDGNGSFSSWDTNNNGIYGEWRIGGRDKGIDFYPDVYVGRLACRNEKEVETVVNKIIEYEENTAGKEWFKRMLLIGGDTFNDGEEKCEGEISTTWFYEKHMQNMGFEKTSLFVSDGTLPFMGMENKIGGRFAWLNVINTMNNGFGFVCMDGHGSPTAWATHFKGHASHNDPWVNGLMTYNMDLMNNKGMYPVVVIGGCHNSEFNISLLDFQKNKWTYQPTYECFGWHFVKMKGKGAIATLGNTGLGYGDTGEDRNKNGIPDCVEFSGGYIEDRFFNAYAEGKNMIGETWGGAITDYINTYSPDKDRIDCKTIEEWVLLGDPSLMIGGY